LGDAGQARDGSVTIFQKLSAIWKKNNLLRRVVKNMQLSFSSNVFPPY